MKFISWNVNGLRACINKGFFSLVENTAPDILAIQETKMQRDQAEIDLPDYMEYWNSAGKRGYSGTAIFTKTQPIHVEYGIGQPEHDQEGRVITLAFDDYYFINCYTPNAQRDLVRLGYRMDWEDAFRAFLCKLDREKPIILCGDLNVAHQEIDLKNPKSNRNNAGFTDQEREKFSALLQAGFIDTFRRLHPDALHAYTWWSYMYNARQNNAGWRIDYFLVSERLMSHITESFILSDVLGSDHCPVGLMVEDPPWN